MNQQSHRHRRRFITPKKKKIFTVKIPQRQSKRIVIVTFAYGLRFRSSSRSSFSVCLYPSFPFTLCLASVSNQYIQLSILLTHFGCWDCESTTIQVNIECYSFYVSILSLSRLYVQPFDFTRGGRFHWMDGWDFCGCIEFQEEDRIVSERYSRTTLFLTQWNEQAAETSINSILHCCGRVWTQNRIW